MAHDVLRLGVAKIFMYESLGVALCDIKKREGGGPEVNVTMTLRNPKTVWMRPLAICNRNFFTIVLEKFPLQDFVVVTFSLNECFTMVWRFLTAKTVMKQKERSIATCL